MQQVVRRGNVIDISRGADDGVHLSRLCVYADVCLHAEAPLVALLALLDLGATLARLGLRGARCRDQRGVDQRVRL